MIKIKDGDGGVRWTEFDKFSDIEQKYLPNMGEGDNMATQVVTACSKLIYKWYNDGDTYDNTNMEGWANDLSDYANWLAEYAGCGPILDKVFNLSYNDTDGYENILYQLAEYCFDEEFLAECEKKPKEGSVYDCSGDYVFEEQSYDDEEEDDGWYGQRW